eukprot:ANDGO_06582.mRNA.1 hypothetical protein
MFSSTSPVIVVPYFSQKYSAVFDGSLVSSRMAVLNCSSNSGRVRYFAAYIVSSTSNTMIPT